MPSESDGAHPDLSPWDRDMAQRVQPVLSALFHDIMGPLTLMKNRLYLIRRHLQHMERDPKVPQDVRERVAQVEHLLGVLEEATNRIHRGMTVPRDAVWETLLEGTLFDPQDVIEKIAAAMKAREGEAPAAPDVLARPRAPAADP